MRRHAFLLVLAVTASGLVAGVAPAQADPLPVNRRPAAPTQVGFSPCDTASCTAPVSTTDSTPPLSMAVKDADGGRVVTSGSTVTGVAQGSVQTWSVLRDSTLRNEQFPGRGR